MGTRVRITSAGYGSGEFWIAGIEFVDGVSVDELTGGEMRKLGAVLRVESVDGDSVGDTADLVRNSALRGDLNVSLREQEAIRILEAEAASKKAQFIAMQKINVMSEDQLKQVADKRSIEGLRVIGDPLGVKDKSIEGLINKIMAAQAKQIEEIELAIGKKAKEVTDEYMDNYEAVTDPNSQADVNAKMVREVSIKMANEALAAEAAMATQRKINATLSSQEKADVAAKLNALENIENFKENEAKVVLVREANDNSSAAAFVGTNEPIVGHVDKV